MGRMAATQAVDGSVDNDEQARSLLNRFLGAQVMMTGVESMMANTNGGSAPPQQQQQVSLSSMRSCSSHEETSDSGEVVLGVDISREHDEDTLRTLLDNCDAYEDRRKVRQRLKTLSANAKGSVSGSGVVTSSGVSKRGGSDTLSTTGSSLRTSHGSRTNSQASTQKSSYSSSSSFSTSQSTKMTKGGSSPFNKFQQMDAQQHTTRRARE